MNKNIMIESVIEEILTRSNSNQQLSEIIKGIKEIVLIFLIEEVYDNRIISEMIKKQIDKINVPSYVNLKNIENFRESVEKIVDIRSKIVNERTNKDIAGKVLCEIESVINGYNDVINNIKESYEKDIIRLEVKINLLEEDINNYRLSNEELEIKNEQ